MGFPSLDDLKDNLVRLGADVTELARHPGNKMIDIVSGYDLSERSRLRNEQEAGNSERSDIYGTQSDLGGRFGGRYDPPAITTADSFDSMSHAEITAAVDEMAVGPIQASAQGWTQIGNSLEQALTKFQTDITTQIGAGWEGDGAEAAREATAKYATASNELAVAGQLIGSKVAEAATGIAQVKATVPPVAQGSILEAAFNAVLPQAGMIKSLLHERDEAHQQAIQVMKTVYTPVMRQADTNVPALPTPLDVTNGTGQSTPFPEPGADIGGGTGDGSAWNPSGPTGFGAHSPDSTGSAPTTTHGAPGDPTTTDAATNRAGENGANATSASNPNANSTLAQTDPTSAWTRPAAASADGAGPGAGFAGGYAPSAGPAAGGYTGSHGGTGTGTGSGYGGGGGGAGSSGFGGGSAGLGGGVPGGMVGGGISGAPASAGTGASIGAAAAGKPGAPGAGMMPGAGARGRGDEDTEHKTPGYLINVDNGNEIVGSLPKVAPPVLGA
ncbi:hypothetical protein FK531_20285 [Rhodococcus spelaei]|uniref:PPE domain-containing protein n=1 Tax=Rhodococcus spelaei TaxID=2546320 RepID=A0A541B0D4_9NOCA|nr:hypothetical protein [Rhodococcus spelaei]TQF65770.1 hypothetical protein FK531_20285 [Rhodococcus spelaei]